MATVRRYPVEIQLRRMASMANSLPMEGRAIVTEDPMKGVRKDPEAVIRRVEVLFTDLCISFIVADLGGESLEFPDRRRKEPSEG
jgi:hypothetical protein